jgi:hypothetical protein
LPEESREQFISLLELEKILPKTTYNQLLKELLTNAKGFDQINIVFDYILAYKDHQAETINFIISRIISNREIRNSFQAQNGMPKLVLNNLHLIESSLTRKFISDFPRPTNLLSPDSKNQYEKTMDIIKKSTEDNTDSHRPKKINRTESHHRGDWNLEIEAGEDELRKWDEEDPSWRIANDLD